MPACTANFFIEGRLLGTTDFPASTVPHSLAYFCTTCGDVWARVLVTGGEGPPFWQVEHAACRKHQRRGVSDWSSAVPGSIIKEPYEKHMLSVLNWGRDLTLYPQAVMAWELERHLDHYERISHDQP